MLKSIFIPSDDFFTNWLDDLNTYFGDKFGILYYPFQLLIDFLNRVSQISDTTTAIISVPSFTLSFMGNSVTIFEAMSFDFNSILVNETYNNIHTIYLTVVDIILWLSLVFLAKKCLNNIIGGMNDGFDEITENENSYQNYVRGQENKKRYKEHGG